MPFNSYPLELWTLDSEELFFDNIFFEGLYALKIERSEGWVLDIQQETFTLLTINNFNMLETEGLVDISLILGNLVDVYIHYPNNIQLCFITNITLCYLNKNL